jgi:hypothetical protein
MNRLFTFGCSFTSYKWPTWADIVGRDHAAFENWGSCGVGNQYIYHALIEAIVRRDIDANDTVMIMWTNFSRWDYYHEKQWKTVRFWREHNKESWNASEDLLDVMLDIRGFYVRDLALIYSAQSLLEKIGCSYEMFSMVDINNVQFSLYEPVESQVQDLLIAYEPTLAKIKPSVHRTVFQNDWHSRAIFGQQTRSDIHPSPKEHLEYIKTVLPKLNISEATQQWVDQADQLVQQQPDVDQFPWDGVNYYSIPDWKLNKPQRW